jgi:hypothetical protein
LTKKIEKQIKKPEPVVLSINICDTIIRDERTKKVSLIGLFSAIHAPVFPAMHPTMCVYIALTNGHGKCKLNIQFNRAEDNHIIAGMEGEIEFVNPLQVVELNLEMQGLKFEKAGEHLVEVLCGSNLIGTRKFYVNQIPHLIPPTKGTEGQ